MYKNNCSTCVIVQRQQKLYKSPVVSMHAILLVPYSILVMYIHII